MAVVAPRSAAVTAARSNLTGSSNLPVQKFIAAAHQSRRPVRAQAAPAAAVPLKLANAATTGPGYAAHIHSGTSAAPSRYVAACATATVSADAQVPRPVDQACAQGEASRHARSRLSPPINAK